MIGERHSLQAYLETFLILSKEKTEDTGTPLKIINNPIF